MSARDDYPAIAQHARPGQAPEGERAQCARALDELDLLRGDVSNLLTRLARIERTLQSRINTLALEADDRHRGTLTRAGAALRRDGLVEALRIVHDIPKEPTVAEREEPK